MDHPFVSPAMNDMLLAGSNRIDGKTHDVYELKWTAERLPDHEIRRLPGTMTAAVNRPVNRSHTQGENSREKVSNKLYTASGILVIGTSLLGETGGVTTLYTNYIDAIFDAALSPRLTAKVEVWLANS